MKILYLHQYFNTPAMSGSTRSYEFARRLVDAGHDVVMITSDRKNKGKPYRTVEDGIQVNWIPVPYSNEMGIVTRLKAFFLFAMKSAIISANVPADVIFATSTPLTISIPAIYAKRRMRIPMVFEVRDLWPEMPIALGVLKDPITKRLAKWLEIFTYKNSNHIVVLSPGMRDGVVATGFPVERTTIIPNASDIERFDVPPERGTKFRLKYDWLGDRKLVVYTGTLGALNGVGYLARVAAEMLDIDPDVRFLVVGSGKDQEEVRKLAERLGVLGVNFFMLPRIPKSEVPDVLAAADVCTSLFIDVKQMWSNSANKFFDALAAGKPVVINYSGWQADLLNDTGAGIELHAKVHSKAARKLYRHISDSEWIRNSGRKAREVAVQRFNRDDLAKTLEVTLISTVTSREDTE